MTSGGADYTLLCSQLLGQTPPAVTQLAISQTLSVGLPQPGQTTYGEIYFAAGTADPALPLTVNGQEVQVLEGGCWGIPVALEVGENLIEARQGENTAQVTITRLAVTEGSWQPSKPQPDDSPELEPGQLVQVTSVLASLLEDPADSSSILQTVYEGMVGQVTECIQLQKGSALTHAYKVAGAGCWPRTARRWRARPRPSPPSPLPSRDETASSGWKGPALWRRQSAPTPA